MSQKTGGFVAYPKQSDIEIPLLLEIDKAGGKVRPQDVYAKVAEHFIQLTAEDLERRLESFPSTYKWQNHVQWARQKLVNKGEVDGSVRGIWKITDLGRKRIGRSSVTGTVAPPKSGEITLQDLLEAHESAVRSLLADRIRNLDPTEFELFSKDLLQALGFTEVNVTQRTRDGGIDGFGKFRQGIVKIDAAFQCKRWQGVVPRPEIDRFRGAISGKFDQGIFLTTSSFSRESLEASIRPGTVPIIMVDGDRMLELMIKNGIGVLRRPLQLLDIDEDFFRERE